MLEPTEKIVCSSTKMTTWTGHWLLSPLSVRLDINYLSSSLKALLTSLVTLLGLLNASPLLAADLNLSLPQESHRFRVLNPIPHYSGEDSISYGLPKEHVRSAALLFFLRRPDFKFNDEEEIKRHSAYNSNAEISGSYRAQQYSHRNIDKQQLRQRMQVGLASAGLKAIGMLDYVDAGVDYLKDKTSFSYGNCGQGRLSNKFEFENCLSQDTSLSFGSSYQLDSMELEFEWAF